jgi:hypothetical protein
MIRRWVALGIVEAEKKFRRMKGHRDIRVLITALRPNTKLVAVEKKVA